MFLHTETTAHSRVPNYIKSSSAEHLSASITLCLLIERHQEADPCSSQPGTSAEIEDSATKYNEVSWKLARVPNRANRIGFASSELSDR